MPDPIIEAARRFTVQGFDTLHRVVDGLPAEALNWQPAGAETNSIAVLTTHSLYATRLLLHVALGLPPAPRDRDAEFAATGDDPAALLQLVDALAADCLTAFDTAGPADWAAPRRRTRADGEVIEVSAAYALLHAVEHLRGHADEAALTRHLWTARTAEPGSPAAS